MNYNIHITFKAERDLGEAADYIEFNLRNSQSADDLLDKAAEEINSLSSMPQRFRLVDDPVLASWGIRFITVNNYLAFYIIDEDSHTVHILRFLYAKRNWISILQNEPISLD
jgi:plasmid stabilization system protein ParE